MANEYGFHSDKAIYPLADLIDDLMPQIIEEVTEQVEATMLDKAYPVGSIYISLTDANPAETLGGEWTPIQDRFLLAAGTKHHITDAPGGAEAVTLTANQSGIPSHTHPNNLSISVNNHTHKQNAVTIRWRAKQNKGKGGKGHYIGAVSGAPTDDSWQVTISSDSNAINTIGASATTSKSGGVQNNSARNATESHNNMPPYVVVYMWQRVA